VDLLIAAEAAAIWFVSRTAPDLSHWALKSPPNPLVGRVAFAAGFAAAVWRAWPEYKPLPVGLAAALVAFFVAESWAGDAGTYAAFMTAAGLILFAALLQESHQLAFRDPLTGLPGRRALEERLRALGGHYAIAMVDVDHFKKFNDTHGHDIGDQVLKLVGGRLSQAAKAASPTATAARSSASSSPAPRSTMPRASSRTSAIRSRPTRWRCARPTARRRPTRAPSAAARAAPSRCSPSPSPSASPARRSARRRSK